MNLFKRAYQGAVLGTLSCALMFAAAPSFAQSAQDWPVKPIRIIVPFPGTGQDTIIRTIAPKLTERLGQPIVIENRAGASGNIGTDAVAKAAPDGYTLLMTASTHILNPLLYRDNLSWDPFRDFLPIANLTEGYLALVLNNNVKAANVRDFIDLARAQPGKLSYASPGIGTPQHLAAELFKVETKTFILHVPYRGSAGAVTDLIGGSVEAMFMPVHTALPQMRQGRLKVLAVAYDKRVPVAPDVPTIKEAGGPNVDALVWYAMYAPAKTPQDIVSKVSNALREILRQPDMIDTLNKQGMVINFQTPAELTATMRRDTERWSRIVREKGLKGE
jgi:tripartite-type tricarboxylate transporter receptor subunit TctC